MKKLGLIVIAALVFAGVCFLFVRDGGSASRVDEPDKRSEKGPRPCEKARTPIAKSAPRMSEVASETSEEPVDEPQTEEERAAADAEKRVTAFDDLTDRWMDGESAKSPTMADVEAFVKAFKAIPKDRQDECVHRALNLIPDANVMLLAGILLDRSVDKEIVETVYNDILNRDEDVKKPILRELYKNKSHPCWADTAWIFDVTGETPK